MSFTVSPKDTVAMDTSQAFAHIAASRPLPQPSPFARRLARLCEGADGSPQCCDELMTSDQEFCRDLLHFAAGPLSREEDPPALALPMVIADLGRPAVASLATLFSLLQGNRHGKCRSFDYQRFWQKALARGAAARRLALQDNEPGPLFFVYGALAAIGELALATAFPEEYGELLGRNLPAEKMQESEERLFGISSLDLTALLFEQWNLPATVREALKEPSPHPGGRSPCRLTVKSHRILRLAEHIARICMLDLPLAATFLTVERLAEEERLGVEEFAALFDRIVLSWQAASDFFEIPSLTCPPYHRIKTMDDIGLVAENDREPLTLLLADDDPITLICLEKVLKAPHRLLLTARDGQEALALALEKRPQLLVTDWLMPGLSGIDLCKILRKTSVTQHTYIVVLTGRESEDELLKAFEAGADDYVTKPFNAKVLQARIASGERLLRSQRTIAHDRETIKRYAAKLAASNRKLQSLAMSDFLTGLPNRRSALQRLKNLVSEVQRYDEPLSCLMIDIDHFKKVNDSHGHDRGDRVLRHIARLLEEKARSYDMVSRWGGEEFLVISARSSAADAFQLAERLRRGVAAEELAVDRGLRLQVTISIGVATWHPTCRNAGDLVKKADQALYRAKALGRNRVEAAP